MTKTFDKKLFFILVSAFVFATIIGTLSHELGHYIAARVLGYQARIHYAYTSVDESGATDSIYSIYTRYEKEIENGLPFPEKEKFNHLVGISSRHGLWFTAGGPLQTMLTGTFGLFLLLMHRGVFAAKQRLAPAQWTIVFITLFWLRETANLVVWFSASILTGRLSFRGDELQIAIRLGWPYWMLALITGLIGLPILFIVIFKFIPRQQRLTFIASGIAGGITGYIVWLYLVGPGGSVKTKIRGCQGLILQNDKKVITVKEIIEVA